MNRSSRRHNLLVILLVPARFRITFSSISFFWINHSFNIQFLTTIGFTESSILINPSRKTATVVNNIFEQKRAFSQWTINNDLGLFYWLVSNFFNIAGAGGGGGGPVVAQHFSPFNSHFASAAFSSSAASANTAGVPGTDLPPSPASWLEEIDHSATHPHLSSPPYH